MEVRPNELTSLNPLIDGMSAASQEMRVWAQQVTLSIPIRAEGSPEGIIQAEQWQSYIDTTASSGSIKYIKKLEDIAGDKLKGWVLI